MGESFKCFDESDNTGQIFGAGPAFVFMSAAEQYRVRMQWRPDKQSACAFRAVDFVRAQRHQIGVKLVNILKGFLAKPLNGVGVKDDSAFAAKGAQFSHRLKRTDLIVSSHHRDKDSVRANRLCQRFYRYNAFAINRQSG